LASRLAAAQHDHHDICISTQRVPLDHHEGLETVVLRGPYKTVTAFADQLVAMNGVRHGNIHVVPVDWVKVPKTRRHPHASDGHVHLRPKN
jgi:CopG family nickel-responsive transcriptional regulator